MSLLSASCLHRVEFWFTFYLTSENLRTNSKTELSLDREGPFSSPCLCASSQAEISTYFDKFCFVLLDFLPQSQ